MPITFTPYTLPPGSGAAALSLAPLALYGTDAAEYAEGELTFQKLVVTATSPAIGVASLTLQPLALLGGDTAYSIAKPALLPLELDARSEELVTPAYAVADMVMAPPLMFATMRTAGSGQATLEMELMLMQGADYNYAGVDAFFMQLFPLFMFGLDELPHGDFIFDGGVATNNYVRLGIDNWLLSDGGSGTVSLTVAEGEDPADVWLWTDSATVSVLMAAGTGVAEVDIWRISDELLAPASDPYDVWSVNAETFAASRYQNFQFNSFCRIANRYFAANANGLFELTGYTDPNEREIDAFIRTGRLDFGTSRLKRIPRVYLSGESDGYLVFCVQKQDGQVRRYHTKTRLRRFPSFARADPAKGLEMHWWQFEVRNEIGQDFELETVDTKPTILQRRVR